MTPCQDGGERVYVGMVTQSKAFPLPSKWRWRMPWMIKSGGPGPGWSGTSRLSTNPKGFLCLGDSPSLGLVGNWPLDPDIRVPFNWETPDTTNGKGMMNLRIREATESDLPAIVDIYNQSIPAGWSTADTRPIAVSERVEWFRKFNPAKRPIWVGEINGEVVATAYLSSFYAGRPAYDATAEVSVYVATAYHRKGIGRHLKEFVIQQCPGLGVTTLLSMYFDHNQATRHINESLGFEVMGHLTEIALVHGQKRGLVIAGLRIPPQSHQSFEGIGK